MFRYVNIIRCIRVENSEIKTIHASTYHVNINKIFFNKSHVLNL